MKNDFDLESVVSGKLRPKPTGNVATTKISVNGGAVALAGNLARLPEEESAEGAVKSVSTAEAPVNEKPLARPALDERTDADVLRALLQALGRNTFGLRDRIRATVKDRCVILEGEVDWRFERLAAEQLAHRVIGVKEVINKIALKQGQTDREKIKREIESGFFRSAVLDAGRITVETVKRKVVLRGTVRTPSEREEAKRIAWSSPGVLEVENYITLAS